MIQAFFFDLQRVNGERGRPAEIEPFQASKVVVLGAGMMGAAIAYVCAKAGIEVVLKDVSQEAARARQGLLGEAGRQGRRARPLHPGGRRRSCSLASTPTDNPEDAAGCDLMIEAVFEDPELKEQVYAEIEPHLDPDALLGSNTSTLPITELAEGVSRPEDFIGLHFFSPGGQDAAARDHQGRADVRAHAIPRAGRRQADQEDADRRQRQPRLLHQPRDRHVHQRGHRDAARGRARADDRAGLVAGGLPRAGAPALRRAQHEAHAQDPRRLQGGGRGKLKRLGRPSLRAGDRPHARRVRPSRAGSRARGFYEYADGKRTGLWRGLREAFPPVDDPSTHRLARPRGADAVRRVARVGQVPRRGRDRVGRRRQHRLDPGHRLPRLDRWRAPVHQRLRPPRPRARPGGFVARARELAQEYGERFEPPASLVEKAERGETYADAQEPVAVA